MLVVLLFELAAVTIGLLFLITQVAVPLWKGTPLVPILRRRSRLEGELAEVQEEAREVTVEEKVLRERERLSHRKEKLTTDPTVKDPKKEKKGR